jgi:hypothetical protein
MGISFLLKVQAPPLDVAALQAELAALPCVLPHASEPRTWWLAGDRNAEQQVREGASPAPVPLFGIVGHDGVWLAIHWHDNRYNHGAHLLHWVLERHACSGEESDYGSKLADNSAIRAELSRWNLVPPAAPTRRRRWIGQQLMGLVVRRLILELGNIGLGLIDPAEGIDRFVLRFDAETAELVTDRPLPDGLEPDEQIVIALYGWLPKSIERVTWADDGALSLTFESGAEILCIHTERPPSQLEGWTLEDTAGTLLVEAANGGALYFTPEADALASSLTSAD